MEKLLWNQGRGNLILAIVFLTIDFVSTTIFFSERERERAPLKALKNEEKRGKSPLNSHKHTGSK